MHSDPAPDRHPAILTTDVGRLIEQARGGDRAAFEALYRACYGAVVRRLSHLVGPRGPVDDLVQETFVQAFRRLDTYRGEAAFAHWLLRIATNVARGHHRQRCRRLWRLWDRPEVEAEVVSPEPGVGETYPHLQLLHRALDRLPAAQREVIVLHELEGCSLAEIAVQLELPLNTVASRLRRGRRRLRRQLEQLGDQPALARVPLCEGNEVW